MHLVGYFYETFIRVCVCVCVLSSDLRRFCGNFTTAQDGECLYTATPT